MTRPSKIDVSPNTSPNSQQKASGKLKVCHIVATAEGGKWMLEQLRGLRDQYGWDVTAIVSGERGALIDALRAENIPYRVENFDFGPRRAMLRVPLTIFRLVRYFRRERFDVIQTHLFFSMIVGRLAAWLGDVPVRLAMIAGPFHLEAHTSRWMDRATCWMETALIPACEFSRQLYRSMGVRDERLHIIVYGPDERKFDPSTTLPANIREEFGWPPDTPLIAEVAYFYPRLVKSRWIPTTMHGRACKAQDDFVKAVPLVLAEFPKAKFLLVGNGWGDVGEEYLEEIKELARSMNLQDSVIFTGYRRDANEILRAVDVAVQPSLSENYGGTLESLLMECPTVATRVGGMVETVRDGETGVLVNPSSPDDLARGIIQQLRDPERGREMGRAGRKLMLESFTLSKTVKDENNLYHRLLFKEEKRRRFYNPLVTLARLFVVLPVLAYLSFRLTVDSYLPIFSHRLSRVRAALVQFYHRVRSSLFGDRGVRKFTD